MVKNPPTMWETWVWSLGWEDPLEKGTATPPVFWPGESQGLYNLWGRKESDTTEGLSLSTSPPVTLPSVVSHYCSSIKIEIMNGLYSQGYSLPSCHLRLSELDHKEGKMPKNWCLWSVVLEKTTEVPCTAKSNQSILREIKPEYSLEGLMLKLKLQYFGHLMWIHNSGKVPEAGKDWGQKEKRASADEMTGWHHQCNEYELGKLQLWEMVKDREAWGAVVHGITKSVTWLGSWTTTNEWNTKCVFSCCIYHASMQVS